MFAGTALLENLTFHLPFLEYFFGVAAEVTCIAASVVGGQIPLRLEVGNSFDLVQLVFANVVD